MLRMLMDVQNNSHSVSFSSILKMSVMFVILMLPCDSAKMW